MTILSRRSLLGGLVATLAAPLVVRAESIMPISSAKLPGLKYIVASGPNAGSLVERSFILGDGLYLPCDGSLVSGLKYPELFKAVRGRDAVNAEDDYIHLSHWDGHPFNPSQSFDVFTNLAFPEEMLA